MKKTLTFFTLTASLLLFTACGDDKKSVTTQDIECTANSVYENGKWYVSATDDTECVPNVSDAGSDYSCPHEGQVAVRVLNSNTNYPSGNHINSTFRSNTSGGFGFEIRSDFCLSLNSSVCAQNRRVQTPNARDYGRDSVDRQDYYSNNHSRYDDGYLVQCVNSNDSNIIHRGGYLYYEYTNTTHSSLSTNEILTWTAIGFLLGVAASN